MPGWVFDRFTAGELSVDRFVVLSFLFRFASSGALARRGETPSVTLVRLGEAICWPHKADSLRKLLSNMRAGGLLGYRVEVSGGTGYRYVFRLFPDGPPSSGQRPDSESVEHPTPDTLQRAEQRGPADERGEAASALRPTVRESLRPASAPSRPPANRSAKHDVEPNPEAQVGSVGPLSLDVLDESHFSTREGLCREKSRRTERTNARARETALARTRREPAASEDERLRELLGEEQFADYIDGRDKQRRLA